MNGFDANLNSNTIHFNASFSTNNHGFSTVKDQSGNPEGTNNYEKLSHKPKVNGVTLVGDKSTEELNIDIPKNNAQLINGAGYTKDSDFEEYSESELLALWKSKFRD